MTAQLDARLRELPPGTFHDLVMKISEIDRFRGWWEGRESPSPATLERVKRQVVEHSAHASTQISDRGVARVEARAPWRRWRTGKPNGPDLTAHRAYAEVLRTVFDGHGEMQFSEALILQLHAELLKYSPGDQRHRGKYKTIPEPLGAHAHRRIESLALRPTAPDLVPKEMQAATEWTTARVASSEFHPLLVTAGFILELLAIRPFADGNGRLSRILTNFFLLQCGYAYVPYASLERVIAQRWSEHYVALRQSQAKRNLPRPDISAWLHAFLDVLRAQTQELKAVTEAWPDSSRLSHNQRRVLALLETNEEVTNRLVCGELGISRDTAKQVLNRLVAVNLLRRAGAGRAVRYRRAPGLAG